MRPGGALQADAAAFECALSLKHAWFFREPHHVLAAP